MHVKLSRSFGIVGLFMATAVLLAVMFWQLNAYAEATAVATLPPARQVAIVGEAAQIDAVVTPFTSSKSLKFLRTHPNPEAYLAEAPAGTYSMTIFPTMTLQLYEVTTATNQVATVISQVVGASQMAGLTAVYQDLTWLSYLPELVIVNGNCQDIDDVVFQAGVVELAKVELKLSAQQPCDREIRLFRINDGSTVISKTAFINAAAAISGKDVLAQPNYMVVGASDGSYIAGSPGGAMVRNAVPLSVTSVLTAAGQNVRVVVFDTVPYDMGPHMVREEVVDGKPIWVRTLQNPVPDLPVDGPENAVAHGTFVASPVAKLAPAADIHLVRVLNEHAMGDAWQFMTAVRSMINHTMAVSPTLDGVVFNYSLVLEAPPDTTESTALADLLSFVDGLNIVQVGAAGNESAFTAVPQEMRLPAAHSAVIGVTAVAFNGKIGCYANKGEIAALGGGIPRGRGPCDTDEIVINCANGFHPEACVSGWDPRPPDAGAGPATPFDWGLGTSFAAPMITGQVAQCLELLSMSHTSPACNRLTTLPVHSGLNIASYLDWPDTDEVRDYLYALAVESCDENVGAGVISGSPVDADCQVYLPMVLRP